MKLPDRGFYYHYKHNPDLSVNNYSYEVVGVAKHSEDESIMVLYRPLYESEFLANVDYCVRPLEMFMEEVSVKDFKMPRFERITDLDIISELARIRNELYGSKK